MIRRKLALESRIARLEKLLIKHESYDDDTAEEVATAVTNWVAEMWKDDPSFWQSALAYINGDDDGDWIMGDCLDALKEQGFVFDNEDVDYISDCLDSTFKIYLEAAEETAELSDDEEVEWIDPDEEMAESRKRRCERCGRVRRFRR